jgi:carboxypeptidase Taq
MRKELERLISLDREAGLLSHIGALLEWDMETYMPPMAAEERAEQSALVQSLAHERLSRPEIGELLAALGSTGERPTGDPSLAPRERAYLRALRRAYDRETKLPADLVAGLARETSLAQQAWAKARAQDDFASFAPHLDAVLALKRRQAACLSSGGNPYDALLDLFEPGGTEAAIARTFAALKADLVGILADIRSRPQIDDSFLGRGCPVERQRAISEWLVDLLPFDRRRGRLDAVEHPFTNTLGVDDVRITTRYIERNFTSSVFSTIHETGHALYEMGIATGAEFARTRLAEVWSAAIHESQSRMWENVIGRSASFWKRNYARLAELAGPTLEGIGLDRFIAGINKVEPSLIRTEADEVTYGLHVILRFELESELIAGRLSAEGVPAAWNAKMRELLGVEPPDDASGCLQDVHWSFGLFGYFPSYALGNLYAAQLWDAMRDDIPGLEARVEEGDLGAPLDWLREKVHAHGAAYLPGELVRRATGSDLDAGHFTRYLRDKYSRIYGF